MMERRDFLKYAGLGVVGALAARELQPKAEARDNTISPEMEAVGLRSNMDLERIVYGAVLGQELTFENQQLIYKKAEKAVQSGLDPFEKDFWKKLETMQEPSDNLGAKAQEFLDFKIQQA